jgi:DNA-binding NtrC family response regulator
VDATDPTPELPALAQGSYVLRVLHAPGQGAGRVVVLENKFLSIGREGPAGLVLDDSEVSRLHAVIEPVAADHRFVLVDQNSRNGVFVNGGKTQRQELHDGDVLRIGSHLLLFQFVALDPRNPHYRRTDAIDALVGDGYRMRAVQQRVIAIAARTEPVLVLGETGVGKELVARALHERSGCQGAFIAVNCAAINRELALSELFGHVRGAFTGALADHVGFLGQADRGTLFLDELGDLELTLQAALLRVLQEKTYRRVGDRRDLELTARVVAATNLPLLPAIEQGRFREDLYHRLRAHTVAIPMLRARREDIPALVAHVLRGTGLKPNVNALEALLVYDWPGNVRELEQVLREAIPLCRHGVLDLDDLREELTAPFAARRSAASVPPSGADLLDISRTQPPTEEELRRVMAHCQGNINEVARFFGKDRKEIHRWIVRHGIDRDEYR